MSYRKYKTIDIIIWLVVFAAFEFLIVLAETKWFPEQPYSISLILPILLLVTMRWSYYGFIHAVAFGALEVLMLSFPGTLPQYGIYILGNLGAMAVIPFILILGKDKVASKWYFSIIYVIIGFIGMELFRGIGAIIFAGCGIEVIPEYYLTDMLNLVFALIFILIARRLPGVFVDQKAYLIATDKQRKAEREKAMHALPDMPEEGEETPEL